MVGILSRRGAPGLEFWRVGPRILALRQASEIGAVAGRRRVLSWECLVSFHCCLGRAFVLNAMQGDRPEWIRKIACEWASNNSLLSTRGKAGGVALFTLNLPCACAQPIKERTHGFAATDRRVDFDQALATVNSAFENDFRDPRILILELSFCSLYLRRCVHVHMTTCRAREIGSDSRNHRPGFRYLEDMQI
jgi:hypothetical protein